MPQVNTDLVALINYLLPGFVTAWLFYSLTAHPRKEPFERTVQALIFSLLIQPFVFFIRWVCISIGKNELNGKPLALGEWNAESSLIVSIIVAFVLGLSISAIANSNWIHKRIPKWVSKRTSYPSEWYCAFWEMERYVYLHLKDGRRLYGWPTGWPDSVKDGHFIIEQPACLLEDNTRVPLLVIEKVLIRAEDVEIVEFEKKEDSWDFNREAQQSYEERLIDLNNKAKKKTKKKDEQDNGKTTD